MAFDSSNRTVDHDGRLHVTNCRISKATVSPYYGYEIPSWQDLGLERDKVYQLLRDPQELEKAVPTFSKLPILSKHEAVDSDDIKPDLIIGTIGSDVSFDGVYLIADIAIWEAEAIAGIETNKIKELSCGYRYTPVMKAGDFNGTPYDGVMTNIIANHLALVEVGRAGSDVVVADHNTILPEDLIMKLKKDKAKAVIMAKDATLSAEQLDNVIDALIGVEDDDAGAESNPMPTEPKEPLAEDETPAEKARALLAGKVDDDVISSVCALFTDAITADSDKDEDVDEKIKMATDALATRFIEANQAKQLVTKVVGDVLGMDGDAEGIYGFALDQMKVSHKDVVGSKAKRALFVAVSAANQPKQRQSMAQDSGEAHKLTPNLARFN